MNFAEVILPIPLFRTFTYSVPEQFCYMVSPGARVYVPFGTKKHYTAIVVRVHNEEPTEYAVKPLLDVLDTLTPALNARQLQFLQWLSSYYLCAPGDVLKAMLPGIMRPEDSLSTDTFKPHTETYVRLVKEDYPLSLTGKQLALLTTFMDMAGYILSQTGESGDFCPFPVSKKAVLAAGHSPAVLKALTDKGILETYQYQTGRLPLYEGRIQAPYSLSKAQQRALDTIRDSFQTKNITLLHGVTASGKTEIYIHLIKEQLAQGRQVLFLLPEIALTLHLLQRLQRFFGNAMGVYHSQCSPNIRAELWQKQLGDDPYKLIVGARSAVMLPFSNLGLVIVDEEHESSYKQQEPAPRYNARNAAMVLASYFGAKTLLGSATPSVESYYLAQTGKYGFAVLSERFQGSSLPKVQVVDTALLRHKKIMKGLFSPDLIRLMSDSFDSGQQVILFQNRRGYSPMQECKSCGWVPKCQSCDVSLTYHKYRNLLSCHYCDKVYDFPKVCPECGATSFGSHGFGTEKIQEEVKKLFPQAKVLRLDLDTVGTSKQYEEILEEFQDGGADVLIGTQMVTKGLDFDRVSTVGVVSADSLISMPDFRATERGFQLMSQVSGRAGRRGQQSRVIIQCNHADNPVFGFVRSNSYVDFYNNEISERLAFLYPPYCRIIDIYLKSSNESLVNEASAWLASACKQVFGGRVLGPSLPDVARVRMQYIRKIMLKIERQASVAAAKERLVELRQSFEQKYRAVTLYFDVDPL